MRRSVYIADIRISDRVEQKINAKHNVTFAEVREAFILRPDVTGGWEDHPVHGPRVILVGTTASGKQLMAALYPIAPNDGIWALMSAREK